MNMYMATGESSTRIERVAYPAALVSVPCTADSGRKKSGTATGAGVPHSMYMEAERYEVAEGCSLPQGGVRGGGDGGE